MGNDIDIWVEDISKGKKPAFEKLFLKFYKPLCNFAYRYVGAAHISEELVQDVFLHIWKSRASLDREKNIKSYLYQAVRNKALNHRKHQRLAEQYNQTIDWLNSSTSCQTHEFEDEDQSAFTRAAQQAIEGLPPKARRVYKLSRKDGLTYKEIAQLLDISPRTVESQISRSLDKLRERLAEHLVEYSSVY